MLTCYVNVKELLKKFLNFQRELVSCRSLLIKKILFGSSDQFFILFFFIPRTKTSFRTTSNRPRRPLRGKGEGLRRPGHFRCWSPKKSRPVRRRRRRRILLPYHLYRARDAKQTLTSRISSRASSNCSMVSTTIQAFYFVS